VVAGNGLIEATTFVAILVGDAGGWLVLLPHGAQIIASGVDRLTDRGGDRLADTGRAAD
jgi:hypothetical protein